ncbi:Hachiman antiphage defense system protein HamA [Sphingobacterium faecium]|uniref:Hachiman antiphage defense system protein HamA n=1 Tax=Sphingobacterium faecium TaxID=34087 RepID=UPI003DA42AD2
MASQNDLVGIHPVAPHFFENWFTCEDKPVVPAKLHRSLISKLSSDDDVLVEWLARKIIDYHYDPVKLDRLKDRYSQIGFPQYAAQHRQLPNTDKTKKGNATEIILIEYIEGCLVGRQLYKAFKFRYNPNVDQSMKGDDALLVEIVKDKRGMDDLNVLLGEAKFRGTPSNDVLGDLSSSLGKDKLPISFSFLVDELYKDAATESVARLFDNFVMDQIKSKGNLKYAGLLLSNHNASNFVENNFQCDNPALVIISASLRNPAVLINKAFEKANDLLKNPTLI